MLTYKHKRMKTNYRIMLPILAGVTAFSGCDKEEVDRVKPQILLMEPAEEEAYAPGSAIHLVLTLSDNVALASYKVNIHGAFDGHSHAAMQSVPGGLVRQEVVDSTYPTRVADEAQPFERTWMESDFVAGGEQPIAGKQSVTINHQLMRIPDSIGGRPVKEGDYHFTVYCTDSSGQESFITREILITHDAGEHEH